jgi:coenzyme F420-0:L-glutamate ligase / coenzyme F420-1:gamma-L-glutamate ligase
MPYLSSAIKERRSIRKYQTKAVPQEAVEEVLVAAGWAPSAHNAQPCRFVVLDDPAIKQQFAESMAEAWAVDMAKGGLRIDAETRKARVEKFASAPVLILACMTMDGMARQPDKERRSVERDLAVASLGAALQNLLLSAHGKGLSACWFCAPGFCKDTVRKVLNIPSDVEPQALILIGYPAEQPIAPPRKMLKDYAFKNSWGSEFT